MNKTLYIVLASIVLAGAGYYYYATQQFEKTNSYKVEKFDPADADKDTCTYDFTITLNPDKLRLTKYTNLNSTLREGVVSVYNGVLDLSRQWLQNVPSEVTNKNCIKEINLNRNDIREFPMTLFRIDELRKIDLSENDISKFPSLKEESPIVSLNLTANNISSISGEDLLKFKNIKHLYFKGNKNLKELPKEITQLKNLKNLDLRRTAIAQDYGKIQKLQKAMPDAGIYYYSKN